MRTGIYKIFFLQIIGLLIWQIQSIGLFAQNTPTSFSNTFPIKNKGVPFITNFSPQVYQGHDQNWSVAQDAQGILYVANTVGLLEYDGVNWRLLEMPNKSVVRVVFLGKDRRLYVGAKGFLGYLTRDSVGQVHIASLMDKIPPKARDFKDVWEIYETETEGIVCRASNQLMIVKEDEVKIIRAKVKFSYLFMVKGEAFVRDKDSGTYKLVGGSLEKVAYLDDIQVKKAVPLDQNRTLLMTKRQLFVLQNKQVEPFATHLNKFLTEGRLYSLLKINRDFVAIGTNRKGILIINTKGQPVQHIYQGNGLLGNNVFNLYVDRQQNLWATLANGITLIEIASPFTKLFGVSGAVYDTYLHQGYLMLGTSAGLLSMPWGNYQNPIQDSSQSLVVSNALSQVWDFQMAKQQLLAGYNPGIYLINRQNKGVVAKSLKNYAQNAWTIVKIKGQPDHLLLGGTNGLYLLEWRDSEWRFKHAIKGFKHNSRYIQQSAPLEFWMSSDQHGLYKFKLNTVLDKVTSVQLYNQKQGLPSNTYNRVYRVNGQNLVATEKGIYCYDSTKDQFVPRDDLNRLIGRNHSVLYLKSDAQANIWYVAQVKNNGGQRPYLELGLLQKKTNGRYRKVVQPFLKLKGVFLEKIAPHIHPMTVNDVLLATQTGLLHYDPSLSFPTNTFQTLLKRVAFKTEDDSLVVQANFTQVLASNLFEKLPYSANNVRFEVTNTFYVDAHKNEYRFQLKGFDTHWSHWTRENHKEYTNLLEGHYELSVQSRNAYQTESKVVTFTFRVLPPWYRTLWAYMGYGLIGLLLLLVGSRLYTQRLRLQKARLEQLVAARTHDLQKTNESLSKANEEIRQQQEELEIQNTYLDQSYRNVSLLTSIGREITANLNLDEVLYVIYERVNQFMDATIFGIGIYESADRKIDFRLAIERGIRYKPYFRYMSNENQHAVRCILERKVLHISDFTKEEAKYQKEILLTGSKLQDGSDLQRPASGLYVPLMIKDEVIGVLSTQSYHQDAYDDYHLNLLQNLSLYVAIAIKNARVYQQLDIKNGDIMASIRYARRIQRAILPLKEHMEQILPEHFVFYHPKDIVSGDFYWLEQTDDLIFLVVADCTGHGVSGALMTMLGSSALTEIIIQNKVQEPAQILTTLDKVLHRNLKSKDTQLRDGMDMAVCVIDLALQQLHFAGAKSSMLLVQNDSSENQASKKIQEVKGNLYSINGHRRANEEATFITHTFDIQEPTHFYLYSDGFQDQFGGESGKKFMKSRFRELLVRISHYAIDEQKDMLFEQLIGWMDGQNQVDDILVVGVKLG